MAFEVTHATTRIDFERGYLGTELCLSPLDMLSAHGQRLQRFLQKMLDEQSAELCENFVLASIH